MKLPTMDELKEPANMDEFYANTTSKLGADEVLIKVCGAAINPVDVYRYKRDNETEPRVRECSGRILEVGRSVTRFRIGDKVCALLKGIQYTEEVVVSSKQVLRVPHYIRLVYAAAFPLETCNAYYAVKMCLQLRKGNILLVHGLRLRMHFTLSVIKVAMCYGVRVFVVGDISTDISTLELYKSYGAEACINAQEGQNIAERVHCLSGRRRGRRRGRRQGANAVLCFGAEMITEYIQCLAIDGVILSVSDGMQEEPDISGMLPSGRIKVCNMYSLVTSLDEKSLESLILKVERFSEQDYEIDFMPYPYPTLPVFAMKFDVGLIEKGRHKVIVTTEDLRLVDTRLVFKLLSKAGKIFEACKDIFLKHKASNSYQRLGKY